MDPSRCLNSPDGGGSGILHRNGTYRNEQNAEQMGSHNSLKGSQGCLFGSLAHCPKSHCFHWPCEGPGTKTSWITNPNLFLAPEPVSWKRIFHGWGGVMVVSGRFKQVTFIVHFVFIIMTSAPLRSSGIRSQGLGTPVLDHKWA